jgi:hypothetical protein
LLKSAALALPSLWLPSHALAQTAGYGAVSHVLYIRLSGGFRFSTAFNGAVDGQFNPFGVSGRKGGNTEWGVSSLLDSATWLDGQDNPLVALGMKRATELTDDICVFPCIDHEPFSGRADGNHGTGLERFLTGYVGGSTAFLTYVNHGLRARVAQAAADGKTLLPAFSLGEAGMATGAGEYAAFRPPVLEAAGFERFGFDAESGLPAWAQRIAGNLDERMRLRVNPKHRGSVEAYQLTREAARQYSKIFNDPLLRVSNGSDDQVDGISNRELETIFGEDITARRAALALRLFHFMNQGGYDLHSGEDTGLQARMDELNRLISGLHFALHRMTHPAGGTYWDHTLVVFGSEFGRTANGGRFNSAGGSDHSSDYATRWMSMPLMGGVVNQAGKGGRRLGETRAADLKAVGSVYSYRSMLKLMLDLLGCDHSGVFPADLPIAELFA